MNRLAGIVDNWAGGIFPSAGNALLDLSVSAGRSFEGELQIRLVRRLSLIGQPQLFLLCTKNFPLNETDFRLAVSLYGIGDDARASEGKKLFRNLRWRLRVPGSDIAVLRRLLAEVPLRKIPVKGRSRSEIVRGLVLDGTTYKLTVRRGLRQKSFTWCCDAPPGWEVLNRITEALIRLADVQARIDSLEWKRKIELLSELEPELRQLRERQKRQKLDSIKRNNEVCRRLAEEFQDRGLTCPRCDHPGMRYIERGPDALSCFICRQCGRSCRSTDLPRSR